ncbi:MAG: linear amide C-N hydrolase [Clostridiales bacterium]|jgi:hypothetical protein|nr:linear amide C-N hydrolase [Clostridiales bacterium]
MRGELSKRKLTGLLLKIFGFVILAVFLTAGIFYAIFFNEANAFLSVKKIGAGLYQMSYKNDYYFDDFLEKGASSDEELKTFIMQKLLKGLPIDVQIPDIACTTFTAITPSGDRTFSRNFDLEDTPIMILATSPKNGYKSISTVNLSFLGYDYGYLPDALKDRFLTLAAPYLPLDGMNEKGVSIAVNMVNGESANQSTAKKDITTTTLIRLVLDKAASAADAVELIARYDLHDSVGGPYHFQIADKSGASVIIEYVANEMKTIYKDGSYLLTTNFLMSDDAQADDFGKDRYDAAKAVLDASNGVLSVSGAMALLSQVAMSWQGGGTQWSVVYNLDKKEAVYSFHRDYSKTKAFYL